MEKLTVEQIEGIVFNHVGHSIYKLKRTKVDHSAQNVNNLIEINGVYYTKINLTSNLG